MALRAEARNKTSAVGWGFNPGTKFSEMNEALAFGAAFRRAPGNLSIFSTVAVQCTMLITFAMYTYALTAVSYGRRAIFVRTTTAELFMKTLFRYRDQGRFSLHGFVIMPEHVHVLLTPNANLNIERCVQLIKGGFSFAVREQFAGEVWQGGYHDHRIRDLEDFNNQLRYIADNPGRRRLSGHEFVHTRCLDRMDAVPESFLP